MLLDWLQIRRSHAMSSARRRATRVDGNQAEIVKALRDAGCDVYTLGRPVDLLVGHRGQNFLLEVKGPKGKLQIAQKVFVRSWRGQVSVVRTAEDALWAVGFRFSWGSVRYAGCSENPRGDAGGGRQS